MLVIVLKNFDCLRLFLLKLRQILCKRAFETNFFFNEIEGANYKFRT